MLYCRLFPQFIKSKWGQLNLDHEARKIQEDPNPLLDPHKCQEWVDTLHKERGVDFSYGGYLENRSYLWRGHYMAPHAATHLGIDFNVPAESEVFLPVNAKLVESWEDPDHDGGWGGRLVFKCSGYYLILAHLKDMVRDPGFYKMGDKIAKVAPAPQNGNWFPHLHVQCCKDFNRNVDGYAPWKESLIWEFPHPFYTL